MDTLDYKKSAEQLKKYSEKFEGELLARKVEISESNKRVNVIEKILAPKELKNALKDFEVFEYGPNPHSDDHRQCYLSKETGRPLAHLMQIGEQTGKIPTYFATPSDPLSFSFVENAEFSNSKYILKPKTHEAAINAAKQLELMGLIDKDKAIALDYEVAEIGNLKLEVTKFISPIEKYDRSGFFFSNFGNGDSKVLGISQMNDEALNKLVAAKIDLPEHIDEIAQIFRPKKIDISKYIDKIEQKLIDVNNKQSERLALITLATFSSRIAHDVSLDKTVIEINDTKYFDEVKAAIEHLVGRELPTQPSDKIEIFGSALVKKIEELSAKAGMQR